MRVLNLYHLAIWQLAWWELTLSNLPQIGLSSIAATDGWKASCRVGSSCGHPLSFHAYWQRGKRRESECHQGHQGSGKSPNWEQKPQIYKRLLFPLCLTRNSAIRRQCVCVLYRAIHRKVFLGLMRLFLAGHQEHQFDRRVNAANSHTARSHRTAFRPRAGRWHISFTHASKGICGTAGLNCIEQSQSIWLRQSFATWSEMPTYAPIWL